MTRRNKGQLVNGIILAALLAALVGLGVLYARARGEARRYKEELGICRSDFSIQLKTAQQRIAADLEQKYSADRISCEVLARRLEAQRAKDKVVPGK